MWSEAMLCCAVLHLYMERLLLPRYKMREMCNRIRKDEEE